MRKTVLVLLGLAIIGIFVFYCRETFFARTISIKTPTGSISALVADSDPIRQKGLGDRKSLPQSRGMLFVFPEAATHAFWMKDMNFPIDIVWIDATKKVVDVTANISPDTYPSVFMPPSPVIYALELNAGKAADFGFKKGVQLDFDLVGE